MFKQFENYKIENKILYFSFSTLYGRIGTPFD